MNRPNKIITHTAASSTNYTVAQMDNDHRLRWPGFVSRRGYHVGYHFVIDAFGNVTRTRDMDEEGAHCIGQNTSSIGVCFIGNGDVHEPTRAQINAWIKLYDAITKAYPNITSDDIYPHRKWANKTCHGKLLHDRYYADLVGIEGKKKLIRELQAMVNRLLALLAGKRMHSDER